jgi:calcineurin-like phosphoesterase family protein
MSIWLTSDEHIDHLKIISYCNRPFKDVAEMQSVLIERHNSVVQQDDTVYHLGDISMSEKSVPEYLKQLNGMHYLICGNHDRCHPKYGAKGEAAKQRYIEYGFKDVYQTFHLDGFLLTHMPHSEGGEHGLKYLQYRPVDDGKTWVLSGHCHLPPEKRVRTRQIDCGVDGNSYFPISLDTLKIIREWSSL